MSRLIKLLFTCLLALGAVQPAPPGTSPDPTPAISKFIETWPDLTPDRALTAPELATIEYGARLRLIRGDGEVVSQYRDEVRVAALERAAGLRRTFLPPALIDNLALWRDARRDLLSHADLGEPDRRSALSAHLDQLLPEASIEPLAPEVSPSALMRALAEASDHAGDRVEQMLTRTPRHIEAEVRSALLNQALSLEHSAPDWLAAVDRSGVPMDVAKRVPVVVQVISAPDPQLALEQVVPALFEQTLSTEPVEAARAQTQLTLLGRPLVAADATDADAELAALRILRRSTLRGIEDRTQARLAAFEDASTTIDSSAALLRREQGLRRRAALVREASSTPRIHREPTLMEQALLLRVRTELHPDAWLTHADSNVTETEFKALLEVISDAELDAWANKLDLQLQEVTKAIANGADLAKGRREFLAKRLELVAKEAKQRLLLPANYPDLLRAKVPDSQRVRAHLADRLEARLAWTDSWFGADARARALAVLGTCGPTEPDSPPSVPTRTTPNKPPPPGPGSAPSPKGVRLDGTLVMPENLDLMGAGVDPETGALYVVASDRELPLPLSADGASAELAKQLLLGVYRSIYVEGYDQLYLSIDPRDFDVTYEHNSSQHAKITEFFAADDCDSRGNHCHNRVRTSGLVDDTRLGDTLYRADVFFKKMMLGVEPLTGRPHSLRAEGYVTPFETWDAIVRRHRASVSAVGDHRATDRTQYNDHLADSQRYCRVWFDMADLELLVDEDGGMVFGNTPVFAHSEPMREVDEDLVPAPDGTWCPDTDQATAYINDHWPTLRERYPELAQLDYVAHLVAFFTWARDLPEVGIFPDFVALDAALDAGELELYPTPRFTSGIARTMESVPEVERHSADELYWRVTPEGVAVSIVGDAGERWWELLKQTFQATDSTTCGARISMEEPQHLARCAESLRLGSDWLFRRARADGWVVEEITGVDMPGPCATNGGAFSSRASSIPALPGKLACVHVAASVTTTTNRPAILFVHGGVQVGGVHPKKDAAGTAPLAAAWKRGDANIGLMAHTARSTTTESHLDTSPWTINAGLLTRHERAADGRPVLTWQAHVREVSYLKGPAGWAVLAEGDPKDTTTQWWADHGVCADLITRIGESTPVLTPCQPRRHSKPEPLPSPPEFADFPRHLGAHWLLLYQHHRDPQPSSLPSQASEWLREAARALDRSDWSHSALMARIAWNQGEHLDASIAQLARMLGITTAFDDDRASAALLIESTLATGNANLALAELDDAPGHLLDPALRDVLRFEALWGTFSHRTLDLPPPCTASPLRGPTAEACARAEAYRARAMHTAPATALALCVQAPMRQRCEELVRVAANPQGVPACRTLTDGRARWRCAASRASVSPPGLTEEEIAADVYVAAGRFWFDMLPR
jgi:hypothetical protein